MATWDFSASAQAQLSRHTYMIYYNAQLAEIGQQFSTDEERTSETISRISEIIAAQTLPVCLVVTGDDLSESSGSSNQYWTHLVRRFRPFQAWFLNTKLAILYKLLLNASRCSSVEFLPHRNVNWSPSLNQFLSIASWRLAMVAMMLGWSENRIVVWRSTVVKVRKRRRRVISLSVVSNAFAVYCSCTELVVLLEPVNWSSTHSCTILPMSSCSSISNSSTDTPVSCPFIHFVSTSIRDARVE